MEKNASEPPVSPAAAGEARRWRVAIPFVLGLIVGGGIGCGVLLLPADVPGAAHAAAFEEATTAVLGTIAGAAAPGTRSDAPGGAASARAGRRAASPPGSWALGGPIEPLPAAAVETRKVWWKMPGLAAAPFAVGSAR